MERIDQTEGTRIVPHHRVRLTQEVTRVNVPGQEKSEPQIILVRDGDAIRAIEVICTCGQRIRMNCVF